MTTKECFREPIPEIADAARYLDAAVSAHLSGRPKLTQELIVLADMPPIRKWTESIWGSKSPYVRFSPLPGSPPTLSQEHRIEWRMPDSATKQLLHRRDGYCCRFCGIPVIRSETRRRIVRAYPNEAPWGRKNSQQHAALQAMWAQYDHVLPHSRGGTNELDNMIVTCAPCNFGRMEFTVQEVGLADPRDREPIRSTWDGLERFC